MRGEDTLCCAQTGSGKTLLFLMPMLHELLGTVELEAQPLPSSRGGRSRRAAEAQPPSAPDALVLVHSRELALQIAHVARRLAAALPGIDPEQVEVVTNGAAFTPQRHALRGGACRLLVGTPGRLLYHAEQGNVGLHALKVLAVDEADALLCCPADAAEEAEEADHASPWEGAATWRTRRGVCWPRCTRRDGHHGARSASAVAPSAVVSTTAALTSTCRGPWQGRCRQY